MKNLIIGSTSQLTEYLLEIDSDIELLSSRNFNVNYLSEKKYDKIFILFAEQRTFLNKSFEFYSKINVDYTLDIIKKISNRCNKIIFFGTSELWNNYSGPIDIDNPYNYRNSGYIKSKEILINNVKTLSLNSDFKIIHPFNYNTPLRRDGFLFQKFMDVVLYKKNIEIGNIDIERDLVHPKLVARECFVENNEEIIVGSGKLTNVKLFYKNLLNHFNLDYDFYVKEKYTTIDSHHKNSYFLKTNDIYQTLLEDTIHDVERFKNKISRGYN